MPAVHAVPLPPSSRAVTSPGVPPLVALAPGPAAPRAAATPAAARSWRAPATPLPPRLLLVGAHGGAGVSTLARLLSPALDAGVAQDWRLLHKPTSDSVGLVTGWTVAATGHATREVGAAARAGVAIQLLLVVATLAGAETRPGSTAAACCARRSRRARALRAVLALSGAPRPGGPAPGDSAGACRGPSRPRRPRREPMIREGTIL